jgi:integral membrane protein (TIGR01906 family)
VDSNDRNELVERIIDIAAESGAQIAGMDADDIKTAMQAATDSEFAQRYIFDNTALDHLDDVFEVVSVARGIIVFCVIASLVLLIILGVFFGRKDVARALIWAGGATIIGSVALGIWAAAAFDALFTWLHGLFFTSGTWVFPASSLLIQIFPENFWIGMGAVWLSVSILCAIVSLVIGLLIRKKK